MLKLPNSIEPAVMAENIVHLRDAENSLDGRVSDLEVTAPKDYRTTETATGQKWIDGKDIYRTVLTGTFGADGTQVNAGNISCDILVDVYLSLVSSGGLKTNVKATSSAYVRTDGVVFVLPPSAAYYATDFVCILEYTKPDPTPGRAPEDQEPEVTPEEKKTTKKKTTK